MLLIVYCLLFNVVAGIPLARLSSSTIPLSGTKDLLSQIMLFKDNDDALLSVLSDADPAKLNEVITLLKALLTTSEAELLGLTTSSDNADTAFTDAVAAHNAAKVALTDGLGPLATTRDNAIATANSVYNQGVVTLQNAVDDAKGVVDSTNSTKRTANSVLALDETRLNSEINTLETVIKLMEGVLGINTISPTSSPTTTAPTSSPTLTAVTTDIGVCDISKCSSSDGCHVGPNNNIGYSITTLPELNKEFYLSFEFKAGAYSYNSQSIIRLSAGNGQKVSDLIVRNHPYGTLYPIFDVNGNNNYGLHTAKTYPDKQWHHVEFSQTLTNNKYIYQVKVNAESVIEIENSQPKIFTNVRVWVGDNWYSMTIKNFFVNTNNSNKCEA